MSATKAGNLLSLEDTAKIAGVSYKEALNAAHRGELPHTKMGKVFIVERAHALDWAKALDAQRNPTLEPAARRAPKPEGGGEASIEEIQARVELLTWHVAEIRNQIVPLQDIEPTLRSMLAVMAERDKVTAERVMTILAGVTTIGKELGVHVARLEGGRG